MTENTPINNTQRIQVVDALRGFAIIAIMLVHFLEHFIYNSYPGFFFSGNGLRQ